MILFDFTSLLPLFAPDILVVIFLFAALGVDYAFLRHSDLDIRRKTAAFVVSLGFLAAIFAIFWQMDHVAPGSYGEGQLVFTPLTLVFKAIVFLLALFAFALGAHESPTDNVSEYFVLLGLSTLGMGFMITAGNLLTIFVSLELTSLSLYALAGQRQRSLEGAEAALKYFLIGSLSSAFLLFGLSYLYGLSQALELKVVIKNLSTMTQGTPLLFVGIIFLVAGLGFKVAVAPFHLWAPDVYQATPTSAAAWIATGSKIASFVLVIRLLWPMLLWPHLQHALITLVAIVAALSMVVGNFGALRQSSIKRLLAYSAIAHSGYIMVGFTAASPAGMTAVLYYVVIYALANLGAFGVLLLWGRTLGHDPHFNDLPGLSRATPGLSFLFLVFILSLAGIPPLSGFLGKYYLFVAAVGGQPTFHYANWLVALALATSVIGLYYYLKILKAVFVVEPDKTVFTDEFLSPSVSIGLFILAVFVLLLGIFPSALTGLISHALRP